MMAATGEAIPPLCFPNNLKTPRPESLQMGQNDEFQPCSERNRIVQFKADGTKNAIQRCGEPTAEHMGKQVQPADCEGCPVRALVTKAAIRRKEYDPPLISETANVLGAKPDDGSDPRFPPCLDRNVVQIGSCCGKAMPVRVCDSVDCWRLGSEVNSEMCRACEHRRES